MDEKALAFLREYEILCRKYGFALCGCGCSDSPYLEEVDSKDVLGWNVDRETKEVGCIWFRDEEEDLYPPLLDTLYYIKDGKVETIAEEDD